MLNEIILTILLEVIHFEKVKNYDILNYKTKLATAYCLKSNNAIGIKPIYGTVASNDYPLGTWLNIEGYGRAQVQDRMAKNGMIDLYFPDCNDAINFGKQHIKILVLNGE